MYVPTHFAAEDPRQAHALIRTHPFGLLLSIDEQRATGSHIPFLHDSDTRLACHLARANPQPAGLARGGPVLAVFQGPHAYVSPSWYAEPGVPTWNYAAVHVYGRATPVTDPDALAETLARLARLHEPIGAPPLDYDPRMLDGIVGFDIEITEIQAKLKLSQNRSRQDRRRVIEQLRRAEDTAVRATASLMQATLDEDS